MVGLELRSESGRIIPLPAIDNVVDPKPFQFALSNTKWNLTLGNLGVPSVLDGTITLDIGYEPRDGEASDLLVGYGITGSGKGIPYRGLPALP